MKKLAVLKCPFGLNPRQFGFAKGKQISVRTTKDIVLSSFAC
jgi:hypothetical protein